MDRTRTETRGGLGQGGIGLATQARRAVVLAIVAGYIDSYTLLHYDVFTSFMSGNTTQTGLSAGQGYLLQAAHHFLPIPIFVAGALLGTFLLQAQLRHPLRRLCELVAALLSISVVSLQLHPLPGWLNVVLFSLAMGIVNSSITHVGRESVGVGFMTGDLNRFGAHLALAIRRAPLPDAMGPWDSHGRRAALLAGVWGSFLTGAVLAGAAMAVGDRWILLPPILVLLLLAASDRRQ